MKKSTLFAFVFLLTSIVSAQNISGRITDSSQQALENVHVYILDLQKGAITSSEGLFEFSSLPQKKLKLQISCLGYEAVVKWVDLSTGDKHLNISLAYSIVEIDEVTLSAGFVNSQDLSVVKIASQSVSNLNQSASPSLLQNLSAEPGVEMISQGTAIMKPVIRGLSGNRVLSIYQGARIENQAWGKEHGVYIPEEGLERIEVIKGPASLLYGSDAMGGVLNFIPEKPLYVKGRETRISLNGFSNTNGYQATMWTKKRKERQYHAFGSGYHSHQDYTTAGGEEVHNSRFSQYYSHGLWGYSMPWGIIEGVYSASYTDAGIISEHDDHDDHEEAEEIDVDEAMPWQEVGDHIMTTQATFWWGGWKLKPHVSYQLNHRKEFEDSEVDEAELDMELRTSRFDFKASNSYKNWDVIIGSQGMHQENENVGEEWLIPNAHINDIALLGLVNWNKNKLQVQFGTRYDYREIVPIITPDLLLSASFEEFYNPSFSLGGTYEISEKMVFRSNFAQGYRAPSLFELFAEGVHHGAQRYELGNANLKSENNRELDMSLHYHNEHIVLDIALFDNHINNFIYSSPTGDIIDGHFVYEQLQDKARLYGGEFGMDFHPHIWHDLHLKSTVSVVYGENLNTDEPLPLMPPLTWRNEARMEWGNWKSLNDIYLKIEAAYYGEQNRVSSEELPSGAYTLVDLGFGASVKNFELGLFARNLFNTSYIPHLSLLKDQGIYSPGRNVAIKLSTNF